MYLSQSYWQAWYREMGCRKQQQSILELTTLPLLKVLTAAVPTQTICISRVQLLILCAWLLTKPFGWAVICNNAFFLPQNEHTFSCVTWSASTRTTQTWENEREMNSKVESHLLKLHVLYIHITPNYCIKCIPVSFPVLSRLRGTLSEDASNEGVQVATVTFWLHTAAVPI